MPWLGLSKSTISDKFIFLPISREKGVVSRLLPFAIVVSRPKVSVFSTARYKRVFKSMAVDPFLGANDNKSLATTPYHRNRPWLTIAGRISSSWGID